MKSANIILNNATKWVHKNSPALLMGVGICGFVFSIIHSIKATVKATKRVEQYKIETNKAVVTKKEVFSLCWKYYVPSALSASISIPAIIFSNHVHNKRAAALATAYTMAETTLEEYRNKTKEIVGQKKEEEIHQEVIKDKIENSPKPNTIAILSGDNSLWFEPLTGRYFYSNWNTIQRKANELNADCLNGMTGYITLSEWFEAIGLEPTTASDLLGWTIESGTGYLIDINPGSTVTKDNQPCGIVNYRYDPKALK